MKILSINAGSSSLKFKMYEMPEEKELISGNFERIGDVKNSFYIIDKKIKVPLENHLKAVHILVKELIDKKVIKSLNEISAVGHRFTQGGPNYNKSVILNSKIEKDLATILNLAPLHNLANLQGMQAMKKLLPNVKQVIVFDNAFHNTMAKENYMYAVPYDWYQKYHVRKYGAHGISNKYIVNIMKHKLGNNKKLIICHIGNGASVTAVKNGQVVNTSMGLTPNAGLIMGSRCGDIDATIIPYIMEETHLKTFQIFEILNKKSGLLGISGISKDLRDIENETLNHNKRCVLAQKMYVQKIVDYIAQYYVELEGIDAIVFTAGVGEKSPITRKKVIEKLGILGLKLDEKANEIIGEEKLITTQNSSVDCYVIPTNEELMIVRDTYNLVK